jgi:hypothetical protein
MIPLRALRAHQHYADLFDEVPFLLWPILWWQLNAMIRWMRDAHVTDVCFQTNWCGFITIRFAAYAEAPDLYKPVPRVFRELSDPCWETSHPVNLACAELSALHALILPRNTVKVSPKVTEGASPPHPTHPCIAVLM